jgi:hypothetical protein
MDNHDYTTTEQQKRVPQALREGPQSTFDLRSRYNVMMPAARIKELRDMGYQIDTIRQTRVDDYGRKHPAVALYVLVEERKCA